MKKGGITIYLSLILCVIVSLLFVCIDSARTAAGRAVAACAADESLFTLFSEYDRTLYEEYGLLFIDGGYYSSEIKAGALLDTLNEDIKKVVSVPLIHNGIAVDRLLDIDFEKPEIAGFTLATDEDYQPLKNQIYAIMEKKMGIDVIKRLTEKTEEDASVVEWQEKQAPIDIEEVIDDYGDLEDGAEEAVAEGDVSDEYLEIAEKYYGYQPEEDDDSDSSDEEDTEVEQLTVPDDFENPFDTAAGLMKMGLFASVLPDPKKLSTESENVSTFPSHRTLSQGLGIMPKKQGKSFGGLLLSQYILDFFPNFINPGTQKGLKYQAEYALAGKNNDADNLKSVLNRILLTREGLNYLYLTTNTAKRGEAEAVAFIISLILLSPELTDAIAQLIMLIWAYAESMQDIKVLLAGGTEPLIKTDNTWQLSIWNLGGTSGKLSKKEKGEMTYEDYLRIFLSLNSETDLAKRTADLLEYNCRIKKDKPAFSIDTCIDTMEVSFKGKIGNRKFEVTRGYGYDAF